MRAELDAGLIRVEQAVDAAARGAGRAEAMARAVEGLVKVAREELAGEMEAERGRVAEAEGQLRKQADKAKRDSDDAVDALRKAVAHPRARQPCRRAVGPARALPWRTGWRRGTLAD